MSNRRGLASTNLGGRAQLRVGRSAHVYRRPIQTKIRRGIDGFPLSPAPRPMNTPATPIIPKIPATLRHKTATTHTVKPALPRLSRSNVLIRPTKNNMSKPKKNIKQKFAKKIHTPMVLALMAGMIFIAGTILSYHGWKTNKRAAAQVDVLSSTTTSENGDVPTEEEITKDAITQYTVANDMPRLIHIPRLSVEARVRRLGVKPNGMLSSPTNIFDAGWYEGSSKPGETGAMLIDGHVHGPTKPGVFSRLNNLRQGDSVEIERGDGQKLTYKVVTSESVDENKVDMVKALTPIEPGKPGLNIITCTGRYDIKTNKYEQRLIVYLVQQ